MYGTLNKVYRVYKLRFIMAHVWYLFLSVHTFLLLLLIPTSLAIREIRVGEVGAKRRKTVDVIYGLPPPLFMPKRSSKV